MTSQKHLKKLVRERMAKTGERYTVARAHVVGEVGAPSGGTAWELRGGVHAETAAFANVLANLGVTVPGGAGRPLDEALVLGVGGGLGAGYILWEFAEHDSRILVLGFRNQWQYPARWAAKTAERLGLHAELHETGSARAAAGQLDELLDAGLPAIVWIDPYRLGHRNLPQAHDGHDGGPVVVYGADGDRVLVDDRSTGRLTVARETLADARARVGSYKNRLIAVDPALVEIDEERLRGAVRDGIRDQVDHLRAGSDSFALPAWRKWARMTTDTRNRKAWPNVFADRRGVASALASIYENAGPSGPGAGHVRGLYAEFLEHAATLLDDGAFVSVAERFRAAASAWDDLLATALPAEAEALERLRALIDATNGHVARGDAAASEAARAAAERWELQARLDAVPPFDDAGLSALFAAIGERIQTIYEREREAIEALADAAPSG